MRKRSCSVVPLGLIKAPPGSESKSLCHEEVTAKLGRIVDSTKGRARIQNDLDTLDKWSIVDEMRFGKDEGKVLHLGGATACRNAWERSRLQHCRGRPGGRSGPSVRCI